MKIFASFLGFYGQINRLVDYERKREKRKKKCIIELCDNFCLQKQDGKDTSIQKRLSWNYGQHIPTNELSLQQQRLPAPGNGSGGRSNKCLSSDSMHSSSGVSSTGSLHLSIGSEWEDSTASTGTVVTATHIYRNLSASTSKEDQIGNKSSLKLTASERSVGFVLIF